MGGRHGQPARSPPACLPPYEKGDETASRGPGGVAALRQRHRRHPGSAGMNELMVHVERAVRAVHASPARKRRMRQELLAHLTGLVEEEKARGGDEREALARALQRFGDPAGLSRDLQASVPRLEHWLSKLFFRGPGESELRYVARLAALVAAIMFVGLNLLGNLLPLIRVAAGEKWSDVRVGLAEPGVFA